GAAIAAARRSTAAAGRVTVLANRSSFASRLVAPHALADDAGRTRVGAWLAEGQPPPCPPWERGRPAGLQKSGRDARVPREGEAMHAVSQIMAAHPLVRALIDAIASSSTYLWELVRADPARLVSLLKTDPDERLAGLRAAAADMPADATDAEAMRLLRIMKAEAALLIALADIGGVWDVMRVTAGVAEGGR